jgi:hypothetical protein
MAWYQDPGAEDKLTVLIRYLVHSFPLASILSRRVEDRYHVFVIVPFDGSREKTLQVETTVFHDQQLPIGRFASLLSMLNLRTVYERGDRYDLHWLGRHADTHHTSALSGGFLPKQTQVRAMVLH